MSRPQADEVPPTATVAPIAAPPLSERPTAAQLKVDIDSGATGDKNPVQDPSLAPLGTDDEAAGTPPSAARIALARNYERIGRWLGGSRRTSAAHNKSDGFPVGFVMGIGAIAVAILGGIWLVR